MAIIEKKISPEYFEKISSGQKKFEFRLADFDIKEGDTLLLKEWNKENNRPTGRVIEKKAGYVSHFTVDSFGQREALLEKGFYIIQLE